MSVWLAVKCAGAFVLLWLAWNVHSARGRVGFTVVYKFVVGVPALWLTVNTILEIARLAGATV